MMKIPCPEYQNPAKFSVLNWKKVEPDENGNIKWHIANFTPDMDKYKVVLAFTQAYDKIQVAFDTIFPKGRVINFMSTDDYDQAQVRYYFAPSGKINFTLTIKGEQVVKTIPHKLDGPGGVLAYRPGNQEHAIYFDEAENWSDMNKPGNTLLLNVVLHESGHIYDLGHSTKRAVMGPYYDPDLTDFTIDDMQAVQTVWGDVKNNLYKPTPQEQNKGCLTKLFGV